MLLLLHHRGFLPESILANRNNLTTRSEARKCKNRTNNDIKSHFLKSTLTVTEVRWGRTGEQNLLLSRFDGQLLPPGQIVGKLHKVHDAVAVHVAELHQALQSLPAHVQAELVAHPLHVVRADQPFAVLQSCQK